VQGTLGDPARGRGHHPQRLQHAAGDKPSEADGDHGHDGERDGGLDEELVQVGCLLGRQAVSCGGVDNSAAGASRVRSLQGPDRAGERVLHEKVGDGEQASTREQEKAAVQEGEA
jgi:hypothetical protein